MLHIRISRRSSLFRAFGALTLLGASACGGSTTPVPADTYDGPIASSDVAGGQAEFTEYCAGCHTGQAGSYGPAVANIAWTPAHMRQQIREGAGRMPGFGADQISADELEKTLAYLATLGAVTSGEAAPAAAPAAATP